MMLSQTFRFASSFFWSLWRSVLIHWGSHSWSSPVFDSSTRKVPTSHSTDTAAFQNISEFWENDDLANSHSWAEWYFDYSVKLILITVNSNDWCFAWENTTVWQPEIANGSSKNNQVCFFQCISSTLSRLPYNKISVSQQINVGFRLNLEGLLVVDFLILACRGTFHLGNMEFQVYWELELGLHSGSAVKLTGFPLE